MSKIDLKREVGELTMMLAIANGTVYSQMQHIEMLNKQLDVQDKAIARKDKQFLGLRSAY